MRAARLAVWVGGGGPDGSIVLSSPMVCFAAGRVRWGGQVLRWPATLVRRLEAESALDVITYLNNA